MPGQWRSLSNLKADAEELPVNLTGLRSNTGYDVEFSRNSNFSDAVDTSFKTLKAAAVNRSLQSLAVNGVFVTNPNQSSQSFNQTFVTTTGDITVTAAAQDPSATVTISPNNGVKTGAENGKSYTFVVSVALSGATETYSITVNVLTTPTVADIAVRASGITGDDEHLYILRYNSTTRRYYIETYDLFTRTKTSDPNIDFPRLATTSGGSRLALVGGYWWMGYTQSGNDSILCFNLDGTRNSDNDIEITKRDTTSLWASLGLCEHNGMLLVALKAGIGLPYSIQVDCYDPSNGSYDGRNSYTLSQMKTEDDSNLFVTNLYGFDAAGNDVFFVTKRTSNSRVFIVRVSQGGNDARINDLGIISVGQQSDLFHVHRTESVYVPLGSTIEAITLA